MAKIYDVAAFFIRESDKAGLPITHLKLQKLCYYAQAWHLTLNKKNLFEDHFEAWVHGPVSPNLFSKYRGFGWNPIVKDVSDLKLKPQEEKFLNEIWRVYGHLDGKYLESLTHNEEPWIEARKGLAYNAPSNQVISEDTMKKYYSSLR